MTAEPPVWHPFDYQDKTRPPAPPVDQMVWIFEESYTGGVTVGLFDGVTWRMLPSGTDDCDVTWWMPMTPPGPPSVPETKGHVTDG